MVSCGLTVELLSHLYILLFSPKVILLILVISVFFFVAVFQSSFSKFLFLSFSSDVDVPSPDEKSVITYVSSIYDAFPKIPEGGEGIAAQVRHITPFCFTQLLLCNHLSVWAHIHNMDVASLSSGFNCIPSPCIHSQLRLFTLLCLYYTSKPRICSVSGKCVIIHITSLLHFSLLL